MKTTPIVLFLISITIYITAHAGSEHPPLFTILGKDVMREAVTLNAEPSEDALRSMGESFPDGHPAYWAECFRISDVLRVIVPAIQKTYIDVNNLRPTEQDVADYIKRTETIFTLPDGSIETNAPDEELMQMIGIQATNDLTAWKFNVAVYEKYGGRISDATYAITPIDAKYAMLKDAEEKGRFTIHDDELRALFWTCMTNIPVTYLSDEEGKIALYKHPADTFTSMVDEMMRSIMARTNATNMPAQEIDDMPDSNENSEPAPLQERGETQRH